MPLEITGVVAAQAFLLGFSKQDCGRGLRSKSKTEEKLYHFELPWNGLLLLWHAISNFYWLAGGSCTKMYHNVQESANTPFQQKVQHLILESWSYGIL